MALQPPVDPGEELEPARLVAAVCQCDRPHLTGVVQRHEDAQPGVNLMAGALDHHPAHAKPALVARVPVGIPPHLGQHMPDPGAPAAQLLAETELPDIGGARRSGHVARVSVGGDRSGQHAVIAEEPQPRGTPERAHDVVHIAVSAAHEMEPGTRGVGTRHDQRAVGEESRPVSGVFEVRVARGQRLRLAFREPGAGGPPSGEIASRLQHECVQSGLAVGRFAAAVAHCFASC